MPLVPRRRLLLSGLHSMSSPLVRKNIKAKLAQNRMERVARKWMKGEYGEVPTSAHPSGSAIAEKENKDFLRLMKWRESERKRDAKHLLGIRQSVLRAEVNRAQAEEILKSRKRRRGSYFENKDVENNERAERKRREMERERYGH